MTPGYVALGMPAGEDDNKNVHKSLTLYKSCVKLLRSNRRLRGLSLSKRVAALAHEGTRLAPSPRAMRNVRVPGEVVRCVGINMKAAEWKALQDLADASGLSVAAVVRWLIRAEVAAQDDRAELERLEDDFRTLKARLDVLKRALGPPRKGG